MHAYIDTYRRVYYIQCIHAPVYIYTMCTRPDMCAYVFDTCAHVQEYIVQTIHGGVTMCISYTAVLIM